MKSMGKESLYHFAYKAEDLKSADQIIKTIGLNVQLGDRKYAQGKPVAVRLHLIHYQMF